MEEKDILAQNLTYYRKKSGLSQLELAKKINYSNKNISKWETGETMPNTFVLAKIAKIYGITIEDLLVEKTVDKEEIEDNQNQKYQRRKQIFKVALLLLSNAILYSVAVVLVYALKMAKIQSFNIFLIFLYFSPLSFLSLYIFIRVVKKFVDIVTLSCVGWLICLSIFLTFMNIPNMAWIFALGGAYQILVICISLLINIKILNKKPKLLKLLEKKEEKSS